MCKRQLPLFPLQGLVQHLEVLVNNMNQISLTRRALFHRQNWANLTQDNCKWYKGIYWQPAPPPIVLAQDKWLKRYKNFCWKGLSPPYQRQIFVSQYLLGQNEGRGATTSNKSEGPQSVCASRALQNGGFTSSARAVPPQVLEFW